MKVLVTGAAGFIGSHLVERLVQDGHEVIGLDNLSTGYLKNVAHISGDFRLIQGDLRNEDDVRSAVKGVEVVYHQGALASVPRSIADPVTTFAVNVTGTLNLLVAARDANVRRVVFASSSSVYGDSPVSPLHEGLSPKPLSPYAVSKLTGEQLCTVFNDLYTIDTVVLRYFNVFGPRQDPDSPYAAVIPRFLRALAHGERPVIFGDGEQTRGFTFVDDVVRGNLLAGIIAGAAGKVMNLSSVQSITVNHCFDTIREMLGSEVDAEYQPPRPGDIRHSVADMALTFDTLGDLASTPLEDGLAKTLSDFGELSYRGELHELGNIDSSVSLY